MELHPHLKNAHWKRTDSLGGGHMSFWFGGRWFTDPKIHVYAEIEAKSKPILTFRIYSDHKELSTSLRYRVFDAINRDAGNYNLRFCKPLKFGTGKSIAVGKVDMDILKFQDNKIDINCLKGTLESMQKLIENLTMD